MSSNESGRHLKFQFARLAYAASSRISKLFQYGYVLIVAFPILLVTKKISFPFKLKSGFGSVLILSNRSVAKVVSSRESTVKLEYFNSQRMKDNANEVSACIPSFVLYRLPTLTCLISSRYEKVPLELAVDCAVRIRKIFDSAGLKRRGAYIETCPNLQAGLQYIALVFDDQVSSRLRMVVESYLAVGDYHTGLCHGDFHSRNIVLDRDGEARAIDLDCVRFGGIVELDSIYFSLEWEWSTSGTPWLETLAVAIDNQGKNIEQRLDSFSVKWNDELGLVFLLDRVGQEIIHYGFKYPKVKLQTAIAAFQRVGVLTLNEFYHGL